MKSAQDLTFGAGGVLIYDPPDSSAERVVDLEPSGIDLYLFGADFVAGVPQWRVEKRSLPDGALVSGFADDGVLLSSFAGPSTFAYASKRTRLTSTCWAAWTAPTRTPRGG